MEIQAFRSVVQSWHTDHAGSPYPSLIYSLRNGRFVFDEELTRKSPPSAADMKAVAGRFSASDWGSGDGGGRLFEDHTVTPWAYAVELIYSGNATSARTYIDLAWKDNKEFASKEAFIEELIDELEQGEEEYEMHASFFNLEALQNRREGASSSLAR